MKNHLIFSFLFVFFFLTSCLKYDDSQIKTDISSLQTRVTALESLCSQMNTNIASLQTLVGALNNNCYITEVSPIEKGYKIAFSNGNTIFIYNGEDGTDGKDGADGKDGVDGKDGENGKDGKDGATPQISVKKGTDGVWYWTLNGEWLLDSNGNKIPATGTDGKDGKDGEDGEDGVDGNDGKDGVDGKDGNDGEDGKDGVDGKDGKDGENGKDGITPQLKIQDEYWYLSVDNGLSWTKLGKATGEDGQDGDSFFKSVSYTDNEVTFVLQDGTSFAVPRQKSPQLDLVFESVDGIFCDTGAKATVTFKITGGEAAQIYALGENGWSAEVEFSNSSKTGSVVISAPQVSAPGKILVFATDTYGRLIMKALSITDKLLSISELSYSIIKAGGTIDVKLSTNLNYNVIIPSEASSWLKLLETKTVRNEVLTFSVAANENILGRSAEVKVESEDGLIINTIVIYQEGDRYYASGTGTESDPYIVATVGQWSNLAIITSNGNSFKDKFFKLGNNLDFSGGSVSPIGDEANPFEGAFDGNGQTVSNASISGSKYLGLFGYVKNANLHDFNLSAIAVSGSSHMGFLAGYAEGSKISNVKAAGTIKSGNNIGGIVGYASATSIDRCENEGSLGNTSSHYAGGIAGYCVSSQVTNSLNDGSMTGYDCIGGLVGYLDSSSSVKNCCSKHQFTQYYLYSSTGGIVGYNCGALCACTMNNTINGTVQGSWSSVGCIVGYDHTTASCRYCYFIKYSILNKNFDACGDLNWGTWYNSGPYDAYGKNSSGYYVTTLLNQWATSNSTSTMTYRKWSGTYPTFAD